MSAGLRHEYDELLGVSDSGVTARGAVHIRMGRHTAVASVVDRAWSSDLGTPADVRAQIAVSHDVVTTAARFQLNAGARMGRLREAEPNQIEFAFGTTLSFHDIVFINATAGSGRLAQGPWARRAAFGMGIALGSVGAHYRYGVRPEGRGSTKAFAFTYTRRNPTPDSLKVATPRN